MEKKGLHHDIVQHTDTNVISLATNSQLARKKVLASAFTRHNLVGKLYQFTFAKHLTQEQSSFSESPENELVTRFFVGRD